MPSRRPPLRRGGPAVPLAAALAAVLLAAGCGAGRPAAVPPGPAATGSYHGVGVSPVQARPHFSLRDTDGRPYDFFARTHGRPTLLYFGYTHCPDACPTAMADIRRALEVAAAVRAVVVFVTTDPVRDTGPVVRQWLDQWSPSFVGLLGNPREVAAAQVAAGVQPATQEGPQPTLPGHPDEHPSEPGVAPHKHTGPLGYAVSHSAVIFAYDASDRLPVVYPGGITPADIAADLPVLARQEAHA